MRKISESEYLNYVPWAKANTANWVYPCSIAEEFQTGDIYVNVGDDVETVLFWHYCGFAYISGTVSERILREILNDVCHQDKRRMLLITNDDLAIRFFRQMGADIGSRIEYEYSGQADIVNTEIEIKKIDCNNIHAIQSPVGLFPLFHGEKQSSLSMDTDMWLLKVDSIVVQLFLPQSVQRKSI